MEAHSPFFRPVKYSLFPPLGLATLAGYMSDADDVTMQDQHVETLDTSDEPDVVVIQVYITSARLAYELADHYRRRGSFVALGLLGLGRNRVQKVATDAQDRMREGSKFGQPYAPSSAPPYDRFYLLKVVVSGLWSKFAKVRVRKFCARPLVLLRAVHLCTLTHSIVTTANAFYTEKFSHQKVYTLKTTELIHITLLRIDHNPALVNIRQTATPGSPTDHTTQTSEAPTS